MKRVLLTLVLAAAVAPAGYDAAGIAGRWLINAYQQAFSPRLPANTCNFDPSCSRFAHQAIESHGIIAGVAIGADRLMRCHPYAWTELDRAYPVTAGGRLYDPLPGKSGPQAAEDRTQGSSPRIPSSSPHLYCSTPSDVFGFARWLEDRGDWYRAGTEYARAGNAAPDSATRATARLLAGESFLRAGRYDLARSVFADAVAYAPGPARLGVARALLAAGRYEECRAELDRLGPGFERERAALAGWTLFREHRFSDAASNFRNLHNPELLPLAELDGSDLPRRSPALAGAFSALLPGTGQLYAGRIGDGVYSLLTVAGSGLLTWWFASDLRGRDRTYIKTAFFGTATALFYAGNVYGATAAARNHNRRQKERYAARADELLSRVRLGPIGETGAR